MRKDSAMASASLAGRCSIISGNMPWRKQAFSTSLRCSGRSRAVLLIMTVFLLEALACCEVCIMIVFLRLDRYTRIWEDYNLMDMFLQAFLSLLALAHLLRCTCVLDRSYWRMYDSV